VDLNKVHPVAQAAAQGVRLRSDQSCGVGNRRLSLPGGDEAVQPDVAAHVGQRPGFCSVS